jgi:valyl-tRNA synthetase
MALMLRAALIFEVKEGNDLSFVEEKVIGMRNFINKIWNIGRFIEINIKDQRSKIKNTDQRSKIIMQLEKEFTREKKEYLKFMESYRFSKALGLVYEFLWHRYADIYIEQLKDDVINGNIKALDVLKNIYFENLKMLHPFVPFVTEAIFQVFFGEKKSILETNFQ